ncbi:NitT/TauT family transport system permease protein [Sphingobium sp. B1D7B]|uniref:ABC transporter permease n=1 Tax=unclassified Sphingobium TaxID=2611147 RepID=UPI00222404BE|nr:MULTISPECIES: ABC transporter permease [unclassified Sphingobium]MCW2351276.1 NitT/TauT family transport system permease protein [Sphingobium sp. B12D2B]MCW2370496.1 NitT/TauT family transport system permease protein [Sphingobium sp. B11D3D]MCW2393092.1 NitT/TauT family transport system permease protein [Sphingobium sp. B11D3A]MCW2404897.1 NitT/TauT family transport system permease protein [Sphingobium sp. B1D7B]
MTKATYFPPRAARTKASPAARWVARLLPPLLLGLLLAACYAYARAGLEEYRQFLMPGPSEIWEGAFASAAVRAELLRAAGVTAQIALTGLAVSIPGGMLLGVLMFRSFWIERAVAPYLVVLQSIPVLAIIPLIQSLLGFGFLPKVLIVALFTFFAIPTTLLLGLKSLDKGIAELFRLEGAGWGTTLLKAGIPSALPSLFAGIRIAASLAVIGAIVSELFFVSGDGGLGQMLVNSKIDFLYEQMYAALIVSAVMSIGVYLFFGWLGDRLFSHWHDSAGAKG